MHGWHTQKKLLNHKHNWILKYLNALFICVCEFKEKLLEKVQTIKKNDKIK